MKWDVVYKRAIEADGTLFFPERLTPEFLDNARRTMGSLLFANQYQNEVLPEGQAPFKKEWLRYFKEVPQHCHTFAFIDPAISLDKGSDYTALVVVKVDTNGNWYLIQAKRFKITPTEIVQLVFRVHEEFKPQVIGIEDVAYQRALLYMVHEESLRRGSVMPIKGIKPTPEKSKEQRVLGLVPRFEWGRVSIAMHLNDFEMEYLTFPRGSHDDIIDAVAYIEQIAYTPIMSTQTLEKPASPNHPDYERWFINNLYKEKNKEQADEGY